jgi:hypothetical protein
VKYAVEAWAPDYGSAADEAVLSDSDVPTDIEVECKVADWRPIRPDPSNCQPGAPVLFVDGVRRIEARVWIVGDDGQLRQGICASYAAGAVRCDGRAEVVAEEVRRGLLCPAAGASDIATKHATFRLVAATSDDHEQLSLCLQQKMGELEVAVAIAAGADHPGELVVVDGPLRQHRHLATAVGYIKTLHRSYGPPVVLETATRLAAGERTPVFVVGDRFTRLSWYVRLPLPSGAPQHPLAGLVRCEAAADLDVAVADRVTGLLPRFASSPHKDARAPQNLYPIAGLERRLRHRLGDATLLLRSLRAASAAAA